MEQGTFLGTWRLHLPTCLAAGRGHLNVSRCSMNPRAPGSVMTTVGQTGPLSPGSHFCHHPEHAPAATCLQTNNRTNVCWHFPHLCPLRGGTTLSPVQANPSLCSWFYTLFNHLKCRAMNYFLDSSFFLPTACFLKAFEPGTFSHSLKPSLCLVIFAQIHLNPSLHRTKWLGILPHQLFIVIFLENNTIYCFPFSKYENNTHSLQNIWKI